MDSRKAKGLDTSLPFLLPWQQAVRQRSQWGICVGSKSQKRKSPWREGGGAAGGRHGSRRRDHVFSHVYKAGRANRKRGEVTNSTHSDFCPSARWHPSPVSLAGKQMFKYLKPWKAFLIKPLHCEIRREQEKKKKLAEESGEGWVLQVRIPDASVSGMVCTYKVSIHEAEEECLRAQGQPELQSKTLSPNLEKKKRRNSKTTNNQCTFIHIHSTNIYPTNIHSAHTFNQDTFMHKKTTHWPVPNIQWVWVHTTRLLNCQYSTYSKATGYPCTQWFHELLVVLHT